jgi:hypothetical protein
MASWHERRKPRPREANAIESLDLRPPAVLLAATVLALRPEVAVWWTNWENVSWEDAR